MKHMQYVGPRKDWRGRSALVRDDEQNPLRVLAQFDFPEGTTFDKKGNPQGTLEPIAHLTSRDIVPSFGDEHPECFGWHAFYPADFVDTEHLTHEVRPIREVAA